MLSITKKIIYLRELDYLLIIYMKNYNSLINFKWIFQTKV